MNTQPERPPAEQETEDRIADYMAHHPDFFDRHPELLQRMELPHQSGGAVSLIERQVKGLREENSRYRKQLAELIEVARENETLNHRLHDLVLALIETVTFDEVVNALEDRLHEDFQADAVELRLFSAAEADRENHPDLDGFRHFLDQGRPKCGQLPQQQLGYLFGPQSDDIRSTALIPIKGQGLLGLLAIGSQHPDRFHPGMGTEYLSRLGEIVSKTLEVVSEPGF